MGVLKSNKINLYLIRFFLRFRRFFSISLCMFIYCRRNISKMSPWLNLCKT